MFVWLATALALAAFLSSALSAHVIGLLTSSGLTARDAVLVSSLIGPMQVAGRVAEFAFAGHLRPLTVGTLAFGLFAAALLVLTQVHGLWIVALAFAGMYGWSNGVMTIVRGTVPGVVRSSPLRRAARPPRAAAVRRQGDRAARADARVRDRPGAHAVALRVGCHRLRGALRLSPGAARQCARAPRALISLRSVGTDRPWPMSLSAAASLPVREELDLSTVSK